LRVRIGGLVEPLELLELIERCPRLPETALRLRHPPFTIAGLSCRNTREHGAIEHRRTMLLFTLACALRDCHASWAR
jgi:hypothetical protein